MEIWDLYDIKGNKVNQTMIRGDEVPKGLYHLVVHIIIRNSEGDFLIQKRSDHKELWPGQWAFTGGSATLGENSELAAIRELSEETGISLGFGDLRKIDRLFYKDYFSDIWFTKLDVNLDNLIFQEEEVSALAFESKETILEMIKEKKFHNYRSDYLERVLTLR